MSRFAFSLCLILAAFKSGFAQEFEEKHNVQEKGNGVIAALKGKATVKKTADGYKFELSMDVTREGRDGTTKGYVTLILLDEKCEPKTFVASVGTTVTLDGSDVVRSRTGGAGLSCVVSTKEFDAAKGYVMVITTKGGEEFPSESPQTIKQFLKREVPAWPEVVKAYGELKGADKSKAVGPAVVRRLR